MFFIRITILIVCFTFVGCCTTNTALPPLPTHPWVSPQHAITTITQRVDQIKSFTATGTLELSRPGHDPVILDTVLLGQNRTHIRLRAWKFNSPVFDITIKPEGTWLWTSKRMKDDTQIRSLSSEYAQQLFSPWWWMGDALREYTTIHEPSDQTMLVKHKLANSELQFSATINKPTLTLTSYILTVPNADQHRQAINLSQYVILNDIPWPNQLVAQNNLGNFTIKFHEVELNASLPPTAFKPASRAKKLDITSSTK